MKLVDKQKQEIEALKASISYKHKQTDIESLSNCNTIKEILLLIANDLIEIKSELRTLNNKIDYEI